MDILGSDECLTTPEFKLLKWICSNDVESSGLLNQNEKKNCCKQCPCKQEIAVFALMRFMKILKENINNLNRYGPTEDSIDKCKKYISLEQKFVLAYHYAKLSEFEKKMKSLPCSEKGICRLAGLIKNVRLNILIQFIRGPKDNETIAKIVRDTTFIDCLFKKLEKNCKCATRISLCKEKDYLHPTVNKQQNCNNMVAKTCVQKKNKACQCKTDIHPLDWNLCININKKDTEYHENKCNLYDVPLLNKCTSTSDIKFKGELVYPSEESELDDFENDLKHHCEKSFGLNYTHQKTVQKLDKIPQKENISSEVNNIQKKGVKSYITKLEGLNIIAETYASNDLEELRLIYNNDTSKINTVSGNIPTADKKIIDLKEEIINNARKVASKFIDNYFEERNKSYNVTN